MNVVGDPGFATTRWSVVLAAGGPHRSADSAACDSDEGESRDATNAKTALATLCEAYWLPLYHYSRRRGYSAADASDLTQGFFSELMEKRYLQLADPERGRFRSFLLTAFSRFLARGREHDRTQKRGGGIRILSLDFDYAESAFHAEPADHQTPERLFERQWAITVLERVLNLLEEEYRSRGRERLFERCRNALTGIGLDQQYAEIAEECGLSVSAVKVAVHRLRQRYRELLRSEVAETVSSEAEVDGELRALMEAVRG